MEMIISKLKHSIAFFKMPDSLFGQLMCILVFGIIILQIANFGVVCSVQLIYIRQAEKSRAENLVTYWALFNSMSIEQRETTIKHMLDSNISKNLREMIELLPSEPHWHNKGQEPNSVKRLQKMVDDIFDDQSANVPSVIARKQEEGIRIFPIHLTALETAIRMSDGEWLKVTQPFELDDRYAVYFERIFVFMEGIVMLAVMGFLLRRVTMPIRKLSEAAETFGKYPEKSMPLPEQGIKEIREAAHSFNCMRERICGNLLERNRMISAMAHDLRTPLTKLQLRLENIKPQELKDKLKSSIYELSEIITQGLELARSLNTNEPIAKLDIISFLQSIVDDYTYLGYDVTLEDSILIQSTPVTIMARSLCLKRCINNIVANACKYGKKAHITVSNEDKNIIISIYDYGKGIPEEMLERVFEPYFRLETSRNRSSGGIGLGLTIARNMIMLNNGKIELMNSTDKGLVARIILPIGMGE